jgi:hypothetical protein
MRDAGSSRWNNAANAEVDRSTVFGQGSFKVVYKGRYTSGEREGEDCVVKEMRSGSAWLASVFDNDIEVVERAVDIIERFNNICHINKRILMNRPEVWEYSCDWASRAHNISGAKILVEPLILNFQNFNSNSGWVLQDQQKWTKVMQL